MPPDDIHTVQVGDVVQTRKAHPCGSDQWQIYRIGADIGMRCLGCERRVMLPRRDFEKAVKKWVSRAASGDKPEQA
ncbi:MAG TPA: DUF951 domain-containing protein [Aggregatilineales bacterium]|nr:DUF951 domain-containing protein [Aggregatilineales bacterium]